MQSLTVKIPFKLPPLPVPKVSTNVMGDLNSIREEEEDMQQGSEDQVLEQILEGMPDYEPLPDEPLESLYNLQTHLPYILPPKELQNLQYMTLGSPTPHLLMSLPDNLRMMNQPLLSLYLDDDCGSVTPGILYALLPVIEFVQNFGLGITYSVKYYELIPALAKLQHLRTLKLYHYPQPLELTNLPRLRYLRSLEIIHAYTNTRKDSTNMCVWIRHLISSSPLEHLKLVCEDAEDSFQSGPHISVDGFVEHLFCRHAQSLRTLQMKHAFIGSKTAKRLLERCQMLARIEFSTRIDLLININNTMSEAQYVRTAELMIVNTRKKPLVDSSVLQHGQTALRRFLINGRGLEGEWTLDTESNRPLFRVINVGTP